MLRLSSQGESLIKGFETLAFVAYQDQRGIWTCGWGHTGPDVKQGTTCDTSLAEHWFLMDTQAACNAVIAHTDVPMTQGQFDAMVSLTFNIGIHAFVTSTLLRVFNSGKDASGEFCNWDYTNHVVNAGLKRRRAAEQELFLAK